MQAAAVEVNQGTYTASSKLTVGQWLDIWQRDYLGSLKPCTVRTYKTAISISKQLSRLEHRDGGLFVSPKSGKGRTITAAPVVLRALQTQKRRPAEMQLKAGQIWDNPHELVFTNEAGAPLEQRAVDYQFKRIVADAGLEGVCFHDTRHPNVKPKTKTFSSFLEIFAAVSYAHTPMQKSFIFQTIST